MVTCDVTFDVGGVGLMERGLISNFGSYRKGLLEWGLNRESDLPLGESLQSNDRVVKHPKCNFIIQIGAKCLIGTNSEKGRLGRLGICV